MKTAELKNILISHINQIDDESYLNALRTIIESKSNFSNSYLEEYNNELLIAEEEIEKGNYFSHQEVKDKMEQWKKN
ncbi:hypothetical protein [Flavobacterium lacus]|uniref:Addiction module component n=1 Tax=Flavobacterium lacus TaxID=1353778 RepID=A0A328WXI9_9FLAO|nr:hypothetical protein [Flavobacterium lacus]RAR50923.1 hypothetical protein B0I10_10193 [Flavobacterium lacus]